MQTRKLKVKMLADIEPPSYAHEGDAGRAPRPPLLRLC